MYKSNLINNRPPLFTPIKRALNVEIRLKALAMYFVLHRGKQHFVMTGRSILVNGIDERIQFSPPGGSVHQRTAEVLSIVDREERSAILADNACREFLEEVMHRGDEGEVEGFPADLSMTPSNVVGCVDEINHSAFDRSFLAKALAEVNEKDVGAYLEIEFRRVADNSTIREYFDHGDPAVEAIANGTFEPPPGHTLSRILMNVVSVDVRDITRAFFPPPREGAFAEGVFLDGVEVRRSDPGIVPGSSLHGLLSALRPRPGEIESIHVMSRETLTDPAAEGPYSPWSPIASSMYNENVLGILSRLATTKDDDAPSDEDEPSPPALFDSTDDEGVALQGNGRGRGRGRMLFFRPDGSGDSSSSWRSSASSSNQPPKTPAWRRSSNAHNHTHTRDQNQTRSLAQSRWR